VRILHLIDGLDINGVKAVLRNLLAASDRARASQHVFALSARGPMGDTFRSLGFTVDTAAPDRARAGDLPAALRWVRRFRADLIQGWETKSNLLAVASAAASRTKVVWGIHNALRPQDARSPSSRWGMRMARVASRYGPSKIVCCATHVRDVYASLGYPANRLVVIENGIDTARFAPAAASRRSTRSAWGARPAQPVIGLVANYAPVKDFACFARAASIARKTRDDLLFVLAGKGVNAENAELMALLDEAGISASTRLLGACRDMPAIYAGFDLLVSTSRSEGLSMVVLEAMSCGVPCVVTDVGDMRRILGESGRVVPPQDPEAIARGWLELLELRPESRMQLGLQGRGRAVQHFSAKRMAADYLNLYEQLLGPHIARSGV